MSGGYWSDGPRRETRTFDELPDCDVRAISMSRLSSAFFCLEGFGWALGYGHGSNRGTTPQGSYFRHLFHCDFSRYKVEHVLEHTWKGWKQWDTEQDAWYYGVWVNFDRRMIVEYCEGDLYIKIALDDESYEAEIQALRRFHGKPPVIAVAIDQEGCQTVYEGRWPTFNTQENNDG